MNVIVVSSLTLAVKCCFSFQQRYIPPCFINSPKLLYGSSVSSLSVSGSKQNSCFIRKERLCSFPVQSGSVLDETETSSSSVASAEKYWGIMGLVELKSVISTCRRFAGSEGWRGVEQQAVSANPCPFLCACILCDKERSWVTFCPSPILSFHTCKSRLPLANPGWQ